MKFVEVMLDFRSEPSRMLVRTNEDLRNVALVIESLRRFQAVSMSSVAWIYEKSVLRRWEFWYNHRLSEEQAVFWSRRE